jgi:uncharacterized caspase-like protein
LTTKPVRVTIPENGQETMRSSLTWIVALLLLTLCTLQAEAAERIALVIGNSNYKELGRLPTASADAKAIAATFDALAYKTTLILDANEEDIRKDARTFAKDSQMASIAVVYYAGHGAQVNGENYLLPVDMGIPSNEADIELTGLKVDDLVNSIRSGTKIIFLDACRDNPALFKNLATGRGTPEAGLAATVASKLRPPNPGFHEDADAGEP